MDRRRKSDLMFGVTLTANIVGFIEMLVLHGWLPGMLAFGLCAVTTCVSWKVDRKVWPRLPQKTW